MSVIDDNVLLIDRECNWWTCRHEDYDFYGKLRKIERFPEIIKEDWKKKYKKFIEKVESEAKVSPKIIHYNSKGPIMYENAKGRVIDEN